MMRSKVVAVLRATCNNSSGVLDSGTEPTATYFSRSSGEASALAVASLSRLTMSLGVPAGKTSA